MKDLIVNVLLEKTDIIRYITVAKIKVANSFMSKKLIKELS